MSIKERIYSIFLGNKIPLKTEKVMFSYHDREVLKDISLDIKSGKITAIIGKSGSGKTTFLKIISGIIGFGYHGKIRIFGKSKLFRKDKIGFVPQEKSFIPDLTIEENIRIHGLNSGISETLALKRASELMELLRFDEDIKKLPLYLSGGQKTRLNIILSLLNDPDLLVLDEPFVGLDFINRRLLWHFLEKLKNKGKAIILTSHLLKETEEHVDKIVLLKDGRVFFTGDLEKLKEKLKIKYIYEISFSRLSRDNYEKIKKYCSYKDINILDMYDKYMMFSIDSIRTKTSLNSLFSKLNLEYEEIGYREPNLDEVFLKT